MVSPAEANEALSSLLHDFFIEHGSDRTYWVAYSGGLDSTVLLMLCLAQREVHGFKLGAIHINHQVNPNANEWSLKCKTICLQNNIQFIEKNINIVSTSEKGFEAQAREQRYAALANCLQIDDILLTAHHQDDQAETLLLQLLRGAGPKGLAAMPAIKLFAKGLHARPLLNATREMLVAYAAEHRLSWIEDDSNTNLGYARNYLRHEIMPRLRARFPGANKAIARSAMHCAAAEVLLEEYTLGLLNEMRGDSAGSLSISQLEALSDAERQAVLRAWIAEHDVQAPETTKLNAICRDVIGASIDRQPCVAFADVMIKRFRDDLVLLRVSAEQTATGEQAWSPDEMVYLSGVGKLTASITLGVGLQLPQQKVCVRFRTGGEVVHLAGRGHRPLKKLFQEWGVPVWQRSKIPLLFIENQLVCVVGYFLDKRYCAKENEMGFMPHLAP